MSSMPAHVGARGPAEERLIIVTSRSFSSGDEDLQSVMDAEGMIMRWHSPSHDLAELGADLARAVGWIAGTGPIREEHLEASPGLRVISRYGVGHEAVDLDAAHRRGIAVTNTPGANSTAVAEHALALMMAVLRRVPYSDAQLRTGDWSVHRGRQLSRRAVGIVGFGRIGRLLAGMLTAMECHVLVHDPHISPEEVQDAGYEPCGLDDVARRAELVSLHAPGGRTVVDHRWMGQARVGQTIVNTARADLVDEGAVAQGLRDGVLDGFGADTLRTESAQARTPELPHASPLLAPDLQERVVVTPHNAAQTQEAVDQMGRMALEGVLDVLRGRTPEHLVVPAEDPGATARGPAAPADSNPPAPGEGAQR